ncbi:MAG TPA: DUF3572 domain-containing protein [Beijerinckiaceae bacterium]|jgi:hypothetical protein
MIRDKLQEKAPAEVAVAALGYLAGDPERLSRFLAVTGLEPDAIRAVASEPGFLESVLDYVMSDEELLLAFAQAEGLKPEAVAYAHHRLAGPSFEA